MKAYKGFTKDMKCMDFQYEEGKEYVHDGEVSVCNSGFHACERPLDCFNYYSPSESFYHEVEINGDVSKSTDDSKFAGSKIKVGARLNILGLVNAQFEYVKLHTTDENTDPAMANAGDYGAANAGFRGAANAGDYGAANAGEYGAANAGFRGAANAGDGGAANAGFRGAANAGFRGAANAGNGGAANAGDYGAANAGEYGAANAGDYGAAISRGSSSVGSNGVALVRGESNCGNKAKGGIGSILIFILEEEDSYKIEDWKAVVVDGKTIKADTWYKLENGNIIEVVEY